MSERVPLKLEQLNSWSVAGGSGAYYAVDTEGRMLSDNELLRDYQLVEYTGAGGSSLCYKAVDKLTGRIVIIKELYPRSLADKGLIVRQDMEIHPARNISERDLKTVLAVFARGFQQELKSGNDVRFFADPKSGVTNDPRFLCAADVVYEGSQDALNRYQMIDTQAGVFLDKVTFKLLGRERVIDILSLEMQILIALKTLHNEKHIAHLDLKPANILVSMSYVNREDLWGNHPVILIDFGSALSIGEEGIILEERPALSTTLEYAASEVKQRQFNLIGKRSDVYSAMIILLELLLQDAKPYDYRSCELIESSESVSSLNTEEQKLLVSFLRDGIERRKFETVEMLAEELERVIRVLKNIGVDEVIIKKNAATKAREIAMSDKINPDLLCAVGSPHCVKKTEKERKKS